MTKEDKQKLDYFKPQLAIRYIQKQINEICLAFNKENKLNESFRDEFTGVRAFKFFTQQALDEVREMVVKNKDLLDKAQTDIKNQLKYIEDFTEGSKDTVEAFRKIRRDIGGLKKDSETKIAELDEELQR
jgi:predicted  nucleic acid-binding Zn-ribbon protein